MRTADVLDLENICREQGERLTHSFALFAQEAWHVIEPATELQWTWHLQAICDHLQALYEGRISRLLINLAPGHAKSSFISVLFPVWVMLGDPSSRWLCASYAGDLALRDNKNRRDLIESDWFQERYGHIFKLSSSQNVKGFWENNKRGYSLSTSVGASGTGKRASWLLVDDANNATDGEAGRVATIDWFGKAWMSRLNDQANGPMIVVGQRIHEEDLSGHILSLGGWTHLNLPEEYEPERKCVTYDRHGVFFWQDPRTIEGELLWPERFTHGVLAKLKQGLGIFDYAAQYQQTPVPATGGTFQHKYERLFDVTWTHYILHTPKGDRAVLIDDCTHCVVVDPALSEKQTSDFCVIQSWAKTPISDILLIDQKRDHWNHADQQTEIEDTFNERQNEFVAVETVAYQAALFTDLLDRGIPCKPYKPQTDKVSRASNAAIWQNNGKMYFNAQAEWLPILRKELYSFPMAPKDDQVDCISLASIVARTNGPLSDNSTRNTDIPDAAEGPITLEEYTAAVEQERGIDRGAPIANALPVVLQPAKPVDPFEYIARVTGGYDEY